MQNLLELLYRGTYIPAEEIPDSPECTAWCEEIEALRMELKATLPKEAEARLTKLDELTTLMESELGYANFAAGFRIGVLLMLEVYGTNTVPQFISDFLSRTAG